MAAKNSAVPAPSGCRGSLSLRAPRSNLVSDQKSEAGGSGGANGGGGLFLWSSRNEKPQHESVEIHPSPHAAKKSSNEKNRRLSQPVPFWSRSLRTGGLNARRGSPSSKKLRRSPLVQLHSWCKSCKSLLVLVHHWLPRYSQTPSLSSLLVGAMKTCSRPAT